MRIFYPNVFYRFTFIKSISFLFVLLSHIHSSFSDDVDAHKLNHLSTTHHEYETKGKIGREKKI